MFLVSGKALTSGKRGKRSYSNTSHHETVQRISESSDSLLAGSGKMKIKSLSVVTVPVKKEWHAPDSYVFDYTSPHASIEGCLETSSLVQNSWFIADFPVVTAKASEEHNPQQGTKSQVIFIIDIRDDEDKN